jgi:hypothetical protein
LKLYAFALVCVLTNQLDNPLINLVKFDVVILSANEYLAEELVLDTIPEKYLYNDNGGISFTATVMDTEETVFKMISFLFQGEHGAKEIYRNTKACILDMTSCRDRLIDFDYLEKFYPQWLEFSGRDNTMTEYGMLIDFIGHARMGNSEKYLLMVISER